MSNKKIYNDWHKQPRKMYDWAQNKFVNEIINEPTLEELDVTKFELDVWEKTDALADLLISKHADYGPKNISQSPGGPLNGLRVRIHDKIARINNLIDKDVEPNNESLHDSFMDLANYAIIAMMVLEGEWPNE